ncbi:MAG: serine protease, partial [Clostridia bacterium]|nr:serine protease [Clostridia bacterium]
LEKDEIDDDKGLNNESKKQEPKEVVVDNSNWCSNIFKDNIRSVVEIYASDENGINIGSGFIISKNGYLLTNNHVLVSKQTGKYCEDVFFQFSNDSESEKSTKLKIIETDKESDIALCKFDTNDVKKFTVIKKIKNYSKEVNQGDDCMIMGNPFGLGLAPVRGCIRYIKDSYGDLVYAASTNVGDSGGAVFNTKGECIGINKSNTKEIDNIEVNGFANATSMETIDLFLNKWLKE